MLTMNIKSSRAMWKGTDANVTAGEYRVIKLLAAEPGTYQTYRAMYDALKDIPGFIAGDGEAGMRCNIRSCIKRLRRKFMVIDPEFDAIVNYQAVGYMWRLGMAAPLPRYCCPTCGQLIIEMKKVVVPKGKSPTANYKKEQVSTQI